jgi:hypothetical protein
VTDPKSLPDEFTTRLAQLKLETDAARRVMRRLEVYRFAIWAAASIVLIAALVTPLDTTGWWIVLALGACFTAHSWLAPRWNAVTGRFSAVMFETQFLAATAMRDAINQNLRRRDG